MRALPFVSLFGASTALVLDPASVLAGAASLVSGGSSSAASAATTASNAVPTGSGDGPTVTLDQGVYVGLTTKLATATPVVNKFLGVPFSDKVERFDPPRPPPNSNAVTQATQNPPTCVQQYNYPLAEHNFVQSLYNNPRAPESEDCLYLNIYTPANAEGLAVLFWILPGAFAFGTGTQDEFDGTSFAANQDVIIVTSNHRTNVFGFPGEPPDVPEQSRNLGIQDQQRALQWVQENIEKFGGDPSKVTIFGESSGAVSVDYLLSSEAENPPFHAAIMESGTAIISPAGGFNWALFQPTIIGPPWPALALSLGCIGTSEAVFECIKKAPADKIKYICEHERLSFPIVKHDPETVLPNSIERRQNHQVADVPIMVGSNWQEYRLFLAILLAGYLPSLNFTEFVEFAIPPELQPAVTMAYPTYNLQYLTDFDAIAALGTDLTFNCPAAKLCDTAAKSGYKAWRYLYNASFPNTQPFPNAGVFHSSEIPLVFGNFVPGLATTSPPPTEDELELSLYMQGAWAQFAKDPQNGPGWDMYQAGGVQTLGELGNRNPTGAFDLNVAENDQRCPLFDLVLDILGD